jgi:hypothetical protein
MSAKAEHLPNDDIVPLHITVGKSKRKERDCDPCLYIRRVRYPPCQQNLRGLHVGLNSYNAHSRLM